MTDITRLRGETLQSDTEPGFVLYWMQQAQRVEYNPALNRAAELASNWQVPLRVTFVLNEGVPDAMLRHFSFMLEGLAESAESLYRLGIPFYLTSGLQDETVAALAGKDGFVITDKGYLRWQRQWRDSIYSLLGPGRWQEVETDVIIPMEVVSPKEEYAAATIRGKILRQLEQYMVPAEAPAAIPAENKDLKLPASIAYLKYKPGMTAQDFLDFAQNHLTIDSGIGPVSFFRGGRKEADNHLELFLERYLHLYAQKRNDPSFTIQSNLSPYLHFGQISSLEVALRALEYCETPPYAAAGLIRDKSGLDPLAAGLASFLEELIVRRELSCNFCHYNPDYDNYTAISLWARKTLNNHILDPRPILYSPDELEQAQTGDPFWNAAQKEMILTGKMHNYMRMYWGKKIIEWAPDPESAFGLMLRLNNAYQLDGRDPNSYAGIAWCFGKHDRPWQERQIFGSVRYMNAAGLKRKFDMQGYLDRVDVLERG